MRAVLLENAGGGSADAGGAQTLRDGRSAEISFPDGRNSISIQVPGGVIPSADTVRRPGRLSPEERRTLRRQIDEVGHDIYTPRR